MTPKVPLGAAAVLLSAAAITVTSTTVSTVGGSDPSIRHDVSLANGTTANGMVIAMPHSIDVSLTPGGCAPTRITVPAGPITVNAANTDAPASSEVGLLSAGHQLGEIEGVGRGLSGSFAVDLTPGDYQLACQVRLGRTGIETGLTVTAPEVRRLTPDQEQTHALLVRAGRRYDAFVRGETEQLVMKTRIFDDAVRRGEVATAKSDYPAARTFYERIEPVAESFGALDALIDERVDGVPPGQAWAGFHQIEQSLWVKGVAIDEGPIASELDLSVSDLQVLVDKEVDQPAQLADGAASLLDEVGATKITGEEERYSHLDAVDLAANVLGATTAVDDLLPALRRIDPTLATVVTSRFAVMQGVVGAIPESARSDWSNASVGERSRLSAVVDAAAAPLAQVAVEVAAA